MQNAGLDESQVGIKIAGRNINNLIYANDITLMAESKGEWKSLLMKVQEESKQASLKLNIQKKKKKWWHPVLSIHGKQMGNQWKQWLTLLGPKITTDSNCSHKIKRCLFLGRKAMINLHSILKSRDITLPIQVQLVKPLVFLVVSCGCESWTIKKAEH